MSPSTPIYNSNNPRISLGYYIDTPPVPLIDRMSFTRVEFSNEVINLYPPSVVVQDSEPFISNFSKGPEEPSSMYFWNLESVFKAAGIDESPSFIDSTVWNDKLATAPSGFVTAAKSMMPKLLVPNKILVSNGLSDAGTGREATVNDGTDPDVAGKDGFNWGIETINGTAADKNLRIENSQPVVNYFSLTNKNDNPEEVSNTVLKLQEPADPPKGDWMPEELVGIGAFCLVFSVDAIVAGSGAPEDDTKKWTIDVTFGEVTLQIADGGTISVDISGEVTHAQLLQSQAKEVPPQAKDMDNPYVVVVYPVWNGLVIQNGVQDIRTNVNVSSRFCIKTRNRNINQIEYQTRGEGGEVGTFDAKNPADVFITTDADTKVDFGNEISLTATNCRMQSAYIPLFFAPAAAIDSFFISEKNTEDPSVTYIHNAWPIWASNNTGYNVREAVITYGDYAGAEDSEWKFDRMVMINESTEDPIPARRAGEAFGYILRAREIRAVTTLTDNGSFTTPGVNSGNNMQDWVKSVSVTIGLDGMSGQLVVDKYGYIGQEATFEQSIGAITIDVNKGPETSSLGRIFSGLGMGISQSISSDGAELTIPLVGLVKKMEDIVLVNVPFFDGEDLDYVLDFLCSYAGIAHNMSNADSNATLPASDDISAPLVNFTTGTTVLDAINQTMELTGHNYVMFPDGVMYFYELEDDGLPPVSKLGHNWEADYPTTKVMTIEQTPDFEDLRNEVIILGLREVNNSERQTSTENQDIPLLPLIYIENQHDEIDPEIAWSKPLVYGVPGYVTEDKLENDIYPMIKKLSKTYELSGRTQVPGNSDIKPYDRWGDLIVISVTHSVDLQGKTWTTDIELGSGKL